MKITNAEIIKNGEKDLIDSITADLDWKAIEEVFLTDHNLNIDEEVEYKNGDIVAYENQVAYKLDFTVKVNLSILMNRDGEYLSVSISGKKADETHNSEAWPRSQPDEESEAATGGRVGAAFKKDLPADDLSDKQDKYLEALGQLSSDNPDQD